MRRTVTEKLDSGALSKKETRSIWRLLEIERDRSVVFSWLIHILVPSVYFLFAIYVCVQMVKGLFSSVSTRTNIYTRVCMYI